MVDIKKVKPNGDHKSGKYAPRNPDKYIGDIHNIIYRSSWEYRFCIYCDTNDSILKWSSEPVAIDYYNPLDKKDHKYNVDFYIKVQREDQTEQDWIIEIKPEKQTKIPVQKRKTQKYLQEAATYAINQEKWRAADIFCQEHGWKFKVVTEKDLGI